MSSLVIYKASAGSGKTYTLSREYIRQLFIRPGAHRHILAVTFTNKATSEMKMRIIRDLFLLSQGAHPALADDLREQLGQHIPDKELSIRAGNILQGLLHDYSRFHISTIDSFFQKIIRSFAREMGLYASYQVEIRQKIILGEAVERMLEALAQHPELREWLTDWAILQLQNGNHWDFRRELSSLGEELFREEFQQNPGEIFARLSDKKNLKEFETALYALKHGFELRLRDMGTRAMQIMQHYGLVVSDFSRKQTGVAGYLAQLASGATGSPNSYALGALNHPEAWHVRNSPLAKEILSAYEELNPILGQILQQWASEGRVYNSALCCLKNTRKMGVLSELARNIREYSRDQNIFLLADAGHLLRNIIAGSDTPFVYEKIGSFFEHFMIDEFQDTSRTQWDNFYPLITNSMASGQINWVVGDVKQAIYRFRNTDWRILGHIMEEQLPEHSTEVQTLGYNWRSDGRVIAFNNSLFRRIAQLVSQMFRNPSGAEDLQADVIADKMSKELARAYQDVHQALPRQRSGSKDSGSIEVRFPQGDNSQEQALEQMIQDILRLYELGYRPGDIAILVRERKEAGLIAETLLDYQAQHPQTGYSFDVLTDESLYLSEAATVSFVIAVLRCLQHPEHKIFQATVKAEYDRFIAPALAPGALTRGAMDSEPLRDPLSVLSVSSAKWNCTPVFELTLELCACFGLDQIQSQAPFLRAFMDCLLEYSRQHPTDLGSFLAWWDETGKDTHLQMPEGQDAIRLMTIHKSKGLEFSAVLIPFCSWKMDKGSNILWQHPQTPPFDKMPLMAVTNNQELNDTLFKEGYLEEKFMSLMDSVNLLYVALTRARHILWITAPFPGKGTAATLNKVLLEALSAPAPDGPCTEELPLQEMWDASRGIFRCGLPSPAPNPPVAPEAPPAPQLFRKIQPRPPVPLVHRDHWFSESPEAPGALHQGRLLHEAFSRIRDTGDIACCLEELSQQGFLPQDKKQALQMSVEHMLEDERVRSWFHPDDTHRLESSILIPGGSICRPDRVIIKGEEATVVDFKFGARMTPEHQAQVRQYMELLRKMGYPSVKGYIWYVLLESIVPVS